MPTRVLMVGLPASGKTTFLAALWGVVFNSEDVAGALSLTRLPLERKYLTDIYTAWLNCEPLERTRLTSQPPSTTLELIDGDGRRFALAVPDVAGEGFARLWEQRHWPEELEVLAESAEHVLLFVRVDQVVFAHPLESGRASSASSVAATPWEPSHAPTQVKLTDLVQAVQAKRASGGTSIVVCLSAWDVVADDGVAPREWLEINLPLLAQMLSANSDFLPNAIVGISAQGGDITKPNVAGQLRQVKPPTERVIVDVADARHHDITLPLRWLLDR